MADKPQPVTGECDRVIIGRAKIKRRITTLARQIDAIYQGKELTILAVLTGSLVFLSDLVRQLPLKIRIYVVRASSYCGKKSAPGKLTLSQIPECLAGQNVLIVDDILDTGQTLGGLLDRVKRRKPASVRTCVLLKKVRCSNGRVEADFVGFEIPDEFVVGYGLDYDDLYRNLPDICTLRKHILKEGR